MASNMASEDSNNVATAQSTTERFFKYFQQEITALQAQMERLGNTALVGGERKDATDHCLAGITRLSSEVKDVSGSLPPYDVRTYSEAIKALQDRLAEVQAQHAPKQKFSFKTRKNESAISLSDAAELAAERRKNVLQLPARSGASSFAPTPDQLLTPANELEDTHSSLVVAKAESEMPRKSSQTLSVAGPAAEGKQSTTLTTSTTTTDITFQSKAHIILPASGARMNAPCTLSNLDTCCVDLSIPASQSGSFASLTMSTIRTSLLLCGSIDGPAHITGVKDSTVLISCRQFRMHECQNLDIYLYCTSRPIIEDCKELRFAEMPAFYADLIHSATLASSQTVGANMWDKVDDFKWLRSEQSPNWMITPTEHQTPEPVWKEIIPGKAGMSVDEILDLVSIKR